MNDKQTERDLAAALDRLVDQFKSIRLEIPVQFSVTLISCLQLALRHPAVDGEWAANVRAFVEKMIVNIEKAEPILGPLLRLGFNPDANIFVV